MDVEKDNSYFFPEVDDDTHSEVPDEDSANRRIPHTVGIWERVEKLVNFVLIVAFLVGIFFLIKFLFY